MVVQTALQKCVKEKKTMSDFLRDFLILVGTATLLGLFFAGIILIPYEIKYRVEKLRYAYRRKHRFDKKPIAKCYCIDCVYYDYNNGKCFGFLSDKDRSTGDCCFCWKACPRKEERKTK